jgi:transitional endoplasmic reticulum ATPase
MHPNLSSEAELAYTRGRLHLKRGEQNMPYAMASREDKTPPGMDVFLSLFSYAKVAASKAIGKTEWIERYRAEMRLALKHLKKAEELAPEFPDIHFCRAQAHRYLGESDAARRSAREAVRLEPDNADYQSFLNLLEPSEGRSLMPASPRSPRPRYDSQTSNNPSPYAQNGMPPNGKNGNDTPRIPIPPSNINWDDVILPEKTKKELRQMQLMIENTGLAKSLGIEPPTGLLLYGPPGTGKTTIARILAAQAKCRFLTASGAEINSMWVGESERSVAKLFVEARQSAPAIIFLDEIDAMMPTRAGGVHMFSDKVVNQFLAEMDGIRPNHGVFVVGATNRKDMLDPALLRGGRLSRQIEIPLPGPEAREKILGLMLAEAMVGPNIEIPDLAEATEGFSGADIKALVTEAGLQALIRLTDEGGMKALMVEDFIEALKNLKKEAA